MKELLFLILGALFTTWFWIGFYSRREKDAVEISSVMPGKPRILKPYTVKDKTSPKVNSDAKAYRVEKERA